MLHILEQPPGNIIATRATERLTKIDYEKLLPILNNKVARHAKIRWYFEMEDFDCWKINALWESVIYDAAYFHDLERVAMVGEEKWQEKMKNLMKPLTTAEVKYFDSSQKKEAMQWIEN